MRKSFGLLMLMTSAMFAETVMVTRNGKTFHAETGKCIVMRRETTEKAKVERETATGKGLRECKSCYRKPGEGKGKGSGANSWAFVNETVKTMPATAK